MRHALTILVICLGAAQSASAGAWLREPGTAFFSVSATFRNLDGVWQSENGLYGEYGLAPRLTLGVDISNIAAIAGHVLVFARVPLGSTEQRTRLALELGFGGHHAQGRWGAMLKTTLSVGRGFTSRWGNGWFNVDGALELRRPAPDPAFKLDASIGLSSGGRIRPLLQFESTYVAGNPLSWSVIPGVMIDGRNNTTWLIGLERKSAARSGLGLKFGLWRQF